MVYWNPEYKYVNKGKILKINNGELINDGELLCVYNIYVICIITCYVFYVYVSIIFIYNN